MDIYIISGDSRIEQENTFLTYINILGKNNNINYCIMNRRSGIEYHEFTSINFLEYNFWLEKLENHKATIIFYDFYNNLDDFDFSGYNLITFGNYLFLRQNKGILNFLNLENIYVFDFFNIQESKQEYKDLFISAKKIHFVRSINYPSALPMVRNKQVFEYKYDVYVPLGGIVSYSILLDVFEKSSSLSFIIGPSNHPNRNTSNQDTDLFLKQAINFSNVYIHEMIGAGDVQDIINSSKVIFLPLVQESSVIGDLTRIADSLSNGKVIITNRIKSNSHIDGLIFFDGCEDAKKKIDFVLDTKLYNNINYKNKILSIYKKGHDLRDLILQLLNFLKSIDAK